ncbi:hypothetical protein HK097_010615 [Rhizophlyctis rosea]|uniref:Uncharacterized protein n=1 Tax=Rhizophlyctis rosea TaxID=64517 RepID=A0AAD5X4Z9_9FUNG|nr:hypothetical protein HK097_010615 [Rhizophlyctis rosea]
MAILNRIPTGVYPLIAIMGVAVTGMTFRIWHASHAPDVLWTRKDRKTPPWETVQSHQTTKIYDPTGQFTEKWSR